jgi:hypothetical protein
MTHLTLGFGQFMATDAPVPPGFAAAIRCAIHNNPWIFLLVAVERLDLPRGEVREEAQWI